MSDVPGYRRWLPGAATLASSGRVRATQPGEVTVTAQTAGLDATGRITVVPDTIAPVTATPVVRARTGVRILSAAMTRRAASRARPARPREHGRRRRGHRWRGGRDRSATTGTTATAACSDHAQRRCRERRPHP